MATIQVRDLPEEVAETFRSRAERQGQSLQTYMRE
ncbi:MAG: antitoxin, partial [Longispora sp.]|nr:antitoxin [Longispora sp. (in: high G+C Gram-positive bacteria)]